MLAGLFATIFCGCLASSASAASLLPLDTESVTTLPSGKVETVHGASFLKDLRFPAFTPPGIIDSQTLVSGPEIGIHVGVGSRVEIQTRFEFLYNDEQRAGESNSAYGAGDARLFTKVRLFSERKRWPALGLRFGAKLPNASKDDHLGTDETDFGIESLISKDFGMVAAHANLGLLILGNPGPVPGAEDRDSSGQDDLFRYAIALVSRDFNPTRGAWRLRLLGEVAGTAGSRFDNDRAALATGLQLKRRGVTLYTGTSIGLVTASQNYGIRGGVIYAFDLERLLGWLD